MRRAALALAATRQLLNRPLHIPSKHPLLDYVELRLEPGGFLTAALSNDFVGCVGRADADNLQNLPALAGFLYNEMPAGLWGTPQKVKQHLSPSRKD